VIIKGPHDHSPDDGSVYLYDRRKSFDVAFHTTKANIHVAKKAKIGQKGQNYEDFVSTTFF
jgi:hypothetical protein